MCGRFALTLPPESVRRLFGFAERPNFPPRYNIAPTQPIAIVRGENAERHFALARWGLIPSWVKDLSRFPLLINARAETVAGKPAFRAAMRHCRCLIPADGFYEWQKAEKGAKRPYLIRPAGGGLMGFAGLWESWMDGRGNEMETAAIITTAANRTMAPIHDRMPAIIAPGDFSAWLDNAGVSSGEAAGLLRPAPGGLLEAVEISRAVNSVANDDAAIQNPAAGPAKP